MKPPIKAARILAGLTQQQLCEDTSIPLITLRRLEATASHKGLVSEDVEKAVMEAIERHGVHFIPENGGGWGVRRNLPDDNNAADT